MNRLTTFSKFILTLLIVGAVVFGVRYFLNNTEQGKKLKDESKNSDLPGFNDSKNNDSSQDADVIKVGVVTWGGYAGGQYFNEGFKANAQSRFFKDYGFKVDFKILDDFEASRAAWKNDDINLLWTTIDAFPTEAGGMADFDPVVVFQADWSRGGDAIVVQRGIKNVADLKGKKIAVAEMTPSHSFLLWLLEAGGLKGTDVQIVKQANAIDAAAVFKSRQVDAAVVWSPDDEGCVKAVPGSKVLQSTKSASNIIADVFIAKRAFVEKNKEKMQQLYEGWMKGAAEINSNESNKRKAAKILAENFEGFTEEDTYKSISNVRLCTHGDNVNFFGLNPAFTGVKGEDLYRRMTTVYKNLGYAEGKVPDWRQIAYSGAIRETSLTGPSDVAEGQKSFTTITEADKNKEAISTKRVTISFRTGEFQLDENSKFIIDREFGDISKAFSNARIRVEGNTDNVGSRNSNVVLSTKRAQSVADYLIRTYNMPKNRVIVIGNGPDKPVSENNSEEGKAKNRRTDFELVE
jgi:NitT/TauT family transport system substrate-binding protein